MKAGPILILFCLCSFHVFAQQPYTVKGSLTDPGSGIKITDATISVLRAKDSILCKFTWNTSSSDFQIPLKDTGHYILLVSYPGYADFSDGFAVDSAHPVYDFQQVTMLLKSKLLSEIIIEGKKTALRMKGDTLEYDASAFKVQPNAKVEDLLKQFPGLEVDKDGKITAQGQAVSKVLLDGEEFFGDDPTLVTKNIRADMVDKVQVYDRASDKASFTGIDDGDKQKTINIKLKEDKKNGYFGKVEAGGGTDKYYRGQAMFNAFKGKERFSAFGILDNTGKLGMNMDDASKYGMSNVNTKLNDDGSIYFNVENDDELDAWDGQYYGEGLPVARNGGLHYENKFNQDKNAVNVNYKIGSLAVDESKNTLTQNSLPASYINTNSNQLLHNYLFRQKLNGNYQMKLDSGSMVQFLASGTLKNTNSFNGFNTVSLRSDSSMLNSTMRSVYKKSDNQAFSFGVLYNKSFKKAGRKFSLNINEAYNNNTGSELLQASTNYYNDQSVLDSNVFIDQNKHLNTNNNVFTTSATYTEPLVSHLSIAGTYDLVIGTSNSDLSTFGKTDEGKYTLIDSALSNNFRLDQHSHQGTVSLLYNKTKIRANISAKATAVSFDQLNRFNNNDFNRNFLNWNPSAFFTYTPSSNININFSYQRKTRLPSINQLQPVTINTDPLYVMQGNPDLKPSTSDEFAFNMRTYKAMTGSYFFLNGNFTNRNNNIVSNTTTDSVGKTTSRYANIDKRSPSFHIYAMGQRKTGLWGLSIGNNIGMNGNVNYNMVNGVLNKSNSYSFTESISFNKNVDKKYYFYFNMGPRYTIQQSSLQPEKNSNSFGFNSNLWMDVTLPKKFHINTEGSWDYTGKSKSFDSHLSKVIVNTSLSRTFLKEDNLRVAASVNDLFNQNRGFNRYINGSMMTQSRYTSIMRFFLLTVTWDFNKMGGAKSEKK